MITYILMAYIQGIAWVIYPFSIAIGLLIGMEIPLATRLNDRYEALKVNISAMMERDYYGSLLGGVFFAFVGLPYLGLTYTPFVLGAVNFVVAIWLYIKLKGLVVIRFRPFFNATIFLVGALLIVGVVFAEPIVFWGEQKRYNDKVLFSKQTKYQKITITQWKEDYWLFLNASKQLCTFDEWLYHEPLVHPVMNLHPAPREVLILGAGDGCAIREVLKYPQIQSITLVDIDPEMTNIGTNHPIFKELNEGAFQHKKVRVVNQDAFTYLENTKQLFDVIIADFPDPLSVEVNRLYSLEFYKLCHRQLRRYGTFITQAAGLHYTPVVYKAIDKTLQRAGFATQPIHNHVYTFGEWTWVIGAKDLPQEQLKPLLQKMTFKNIPLRWLNQEGMSLITSFGRDLMPIDTAEIQVNTLQNPVLYKYYQDGTWDKYFEGGLGN
jgi:spermidine synthase